jgi:YVTN family beta-propeller protein
MEMVRKMKKLFETFIVVSLLFAGCTNDAKTTWIAQAPAGSAYTKINRADKTVLPNGRFITPLGKQIQTAPHPYGLTLSPDGNVVVTANSGIRPFSLSIIRNFNSGHPDVQQIPPGHETDEGILAAVFMGLAISPDNKTLYAAGGQENKIYLFDLTSGLSKGEINCALKSDSMDYSHGYIGDLVLTSDGKTMYAVDQIGFRLVVIDAMQKKVIYNIPVGRYPFGVTLSPDEKSVYVANVGMFAYQPFEGLTENNMKAKALKYPAFGYNTKDMREGRTIDSLKIPGLGDPNSPEAFSVWKVEISTSMPQVTARIKTGFLVGQPVEGIPAVGGASPNSLVATDEYIFVSNGNNDCISVISAQEDTVIRTIFLKPDYRLKHYRGVIPFGMTLSPDKKRLYVAESGINAIAVIDTRTFEVMGHIPTGWFPSKLQVTPDGQNLIVANAKGYGSGPNGGKMFTRGPEGSYVGNLMKGTVSIIPIPADTELKKLTNKVIENNYLFALPDDSSFISRRNNPIPLYPGEKASPIRHIVFISKENRTYDEVFGQNEKGRGEAGLARYGKNVTFKNRSGSQTVENATVMRNHLALAERFAISDNFYCDSDVSADGHRWLVNTYPNQWVETSVASSYGGGREMRENSKALGNLALVGSSGAIYPEDYNEAGSIWEHLDRNGKDFFNFGFGLELAPSLSDNTFKYTGVRFVINYPVPEPLFRKSSKIYATYNMGIPDQFRADMFMKEFNERWTGKGKTMPDMLTVILPNDHGSGERPDEGYPFTESYMADNDLALGRVVEFLSQTPYWKNMLIVVTEDDPQGGVDHVDAHRSVLMVISPYVRKNYVSHVHYSFGSIFKTFWNILGVPYLNQYDAAATDLSDFFSDRPDTSIFRALAVDQRIFDPQKALDPLDEKFNWKAVAESPLIDNPQDMMKESIYQDSILTTQKGSNSK